MSRPNIFIRLMQWVVVHYDVSYILTPFATSNIARQYVVGTAMNKRKITIGWTHVYVFGIKVASFQRTNPW